MACRGSGVRIPSAPPIEEAGSTIGFGSRPRSLRRIRRRVSLAAGDATVGAEPCRWSVERSAGVTDSPSTPPATQADLGGGTYGPFAYVSAPNAPAVSYTHLTLPTIYS